jgi:hypothetical protein
MRHLIELVGIGQQLVVVELDDVGDPVRVLARGRRQHADRGRDRVAAALDRQLDDVRRVEVGGVGGEAGARRVLDPLVDREDREVTGARQAPVVEHRAEVADRGHAAVGVEHHPLDEVRARQMQVLGTDRLAAVLQQALGVIAEQIGDRVERRLGDAGHGLSPCACRSDWPDPARARGQGLRR